MTTQSTLVLIFEGVEEIEALTPVDLLRRAGVEVDLLTVGDDPLITGRNGISIQGQACFGKVDKRYDLIVVPGGPGHAALLDNQAVLKALTDHAEEGRLLASICAGPLVLQKAGLLDGKRFTAFPATARLFTQPPEDQAVVIDHGLVTSRGAGTAYAFALALIEALCGAEAAKAIANETCYS
jgi:4-methyl-5(b-hydroxyethyl)-thiazole monophosphate biosynthesis